MAIFNWIIVVCWFVFIIYWLFSSISAKKSIRTRSWWKGASIRVALIVVILLLIHIPIFKGAVAHFYYTYLGTDIFSIWLGLIGVIFCVAGIALAIWARVYLGKNWGMPMSLQEGHELVTSGPYALVRHPIYSGMLLAVLGSVFAAGIVWLTIWIFFGIYFIYSATVEEKMMVKQFPTEYPPYIKRTKMLIPFVL